MGVGGLPCHSTKKQIGSAASDLLGLELQGSDVVVVKSPPLTIHWALGMGLEVPPGNWKADGEGV